MTSAKFPYSVLNSKTFNANITGTLPKLSVTGINSKCQENYNIILFNEILESIYSHAVVDSNQSRVIFSDSGPIKHENDRENIR